MGLISKIRTALSLEKEVRYNKMVQLLNSKFDTRFKPRKMYEDYPKTIRVVTTRVCNMSCNLCPSVELNRAKNYKQQFMDMRLVKKIIDEVKDYPKLELSPFALEPTVNPNTVDMIKYAVSKGVNLRGFFTNAQLLDEKMSRELLDAGLCEINFSIDAADEEGYMLTRNSEDYDLVVKNVNKFLKLNEAGGYGAFTTVSYVVSNETAPKVEKFREIWKDRVNKIFFQEFEFQSGGQKKDFTPIKKEKKRLACSYPWYRLAINIDGKFIYCPDDWYETDLFGDIRKNTISEIWNGEKYQQIRQRHIDREFDRIPVCAECLDWRTPGKEF